MELGALNRSMEQEGRFDSECRNPVASAWTDYRDPLLKPGAGLAWR
jgi:hypothetical protein